MSQEERELLLKDLCSRLPYGLLVKTPDHFNPQVVDGINNELEVTVQNNLCYSLLFEAKPYLRPMSSMTEEENRQYGELCDEDIHQLTYVQIVHPGLKYKTSCHRSIDWLNAHHFDYRGLIEKGIVLEAPKEMYK